MERTGVRADNSRDGAREAPMRPPRARESARAIERGGPVYAALDLGTNNCRLLVATAGRTGFRVIDSFSRITRLGEGLGASGRLTDAAMDRTIEALRACAAKMRRNRVTHSRLVATEACRRAANCDVFLERVRAETGLALDIIDSAEEAQLAAAGCASLLDWSRRHALVFDIGGGSTELIALMLEAPARPVVQDWISLPLGVVTLAERAADSALAGDYERVVGEVAAQLAPFAAANGFAAALATDSLQMLGTSGTVTTVAAVNLGLPRYVRARVDGVTLTFDDIVRVAADLRAMSLAARAAHPCIRAERADLVVAGCAILEAICRTWPVGRLRVADRGLREGIILALMAAA